MKYTVEMVSDGIINVPSFMTIRWGIRVILKLISEQFKRP
jgi:hypothetical protein